MIINLGSETVSAFVVETVSGVTLAAYPPPEGYWPNIRKTCDRHNVLLILKYRYLGSSGLLMSLITLGTMTLGAPDWGCDERVAHSIFKKYIEAGGNTLDIADIYAGGRSEAIVGNLIPELNRDGLIIASKCPLPSGPAVTQFGANRKQIISACEISLKRLKTDYIEIYHIHVPDPIPSLEETLRSMDDLVRQGMVRYTGSSMFFGWQLTKARGISAIYHL